MSDFVGKNNKTTIIGRLTKAGSQPPQREAPINEETQKKMMSYAHKKREESKKLMENDEDH